ncbi:MAG: hypothetical protein OEQ39_15465 [Gammaproteobacteria bacterium]|nr:hypothetical protein [Gammaproteobacteria bacterium]MDH3467720.1 hypothetical protein [Gammaproteobacteria bacterium]
MTVNTGWSVTPEESEPVNDLSTVPNTEPQLDALLEQATQLKREHRLVDAAAVLERAYQRATGQIAMQDTIRRELDFNIPLLEAEQRFNRGDVAGAKHVLQWTRGRNRDNPDRQRILENLLIRISSIPTQAAAEPTNRDEVVAQIRDEMRRFRDQYKRYPNGYRELNSLLAPDRPPLTHFDVTYYGLTNGGYVIEIRSKSNPDNLISIQRTGLLE